MKIKKIFSKRHKAYRYLLNCRIDNVRIRQSFPKKEDAIAAYQELNANSFKAKRGLEIPKPKITLERLQADLAPYEKRGDVLSAFKRFVDIVGKETELTALRKASWTRYADSIRHLAPSTYNKYLAYCSGCLRRAETLYGEFDDWRPPQAPYVEKPDSRNIELTDCDLTQILTGLSAPRFKGERACRAATRHRFADMFSLMLLTGARDGELFSLTEDDVKLGAQVLWAKREIKIISIKGPKAKPLTRFVPMSETVYQILRKIQPLGYFAGLSKSQLYRSLCSAAQAMGFDYGRGTAWTMHDLRHQAATAMESAGIPLSAISAVLGHSFKDQLAQRGLAPMTARYAHAGLTTKQLAVRALEERYKFLAAFWPNSSDIGCPPVMSSDI